MVQVNGSLRWLTQRFSRERAGRVKYSTLCPSRSDSPSDARRAMPTNGDFSRIGNKGKVGRVIFAFCSPMIDFRLPICQEVDGNGWKRMGSEGIRWAGNSCLDDSSVKAGERVAGHRPRSAIGRQAGASNLQ